MSHSAGILGLRRFAEQVDRPALGAILALLLLSLVTLYSVTRTPVLDLGQRGLDVGEGVFWRQIVWIVIGLGALYVGFHLPFRLLEATAWLQYAVVLLLLIAVLLVGGSGVERWIRLGPVQFQPSEFAKIAVVFVLARYLARSAGNGNRLRNVILPLCIVLPPVGLILRQPDLGTSLVFFAILGPLLYWRGLKLWHMLLLVSPGISFLLHLYFRTQHATLWPWLVFVVLVFGVTLWRRLYLLENICMLVVNASVHVLEPMLWERLRQYQQQRIVSFFDPSIDPMGQGYHVAQSKIAVGAGGFLGQGFMEGTQKELAFLPARHTDFIFSVVGEEFGFVGAVLVVSLFALLVVRGIGFAARARNGFVRYAAFGITSYVMFQVTQNVGMTVGLLPVTGIPLPLVSYGGSSLLVTLFLMGVLLNLGARWREY
ncbi:MAG: rod shape-determining protein RodA [Candidatus Latescibacterota bacterium]|nr:MAG: rod shape-determining protein RodA [Candidatus Latescibacterota bacterium]